MIWKMKDEFKLCCFSGTVAVDDLKKKSSYFIRYSCGRWLEKNDIVFFIRDSCGRRRKKLCSLFYQGQLRSMTWQKNDVIYQGQLRSMTYTSRRDTWLNTDPHDIAAHPLQPGYKSSIFPPPGCRCNLIFVHLHRYGSLRPVYIMYCWPLPVSCKDRYVLHVFHW